MTQFDVVVIGGGIHGAGVTQAAQAAGYSTVLIEKSHWAAGTSSKSSKLIHGGLRYLETAQFSLVWNSLRERRLLLDIAPALVKPLRFNIPVYPHTSRRPWQLRLGLALYALLAGFTPLARFNTLSAKEKSQLPGLEKSGLQAVFSYWDAQTDDARLTSAVVASAQQLGAELHCPVRVTAVHPQSDGFSLCLDDNRQPSLHGRVIINTAGPWANGILGCFDPPIQPLAIELVKGSHLVIKGKIHNDAFYLEAEDGRAIFVLPWGENALLGTTEQIYTGEPENVAISPAERDYLLKTFHRYFPASSATVIDEFAGLRVLPAASGKPFLRSRECIYHVDRNAPGVMTLYGGKLTSYRHTADKVVRWITSQIGERQAVADTRKLRLNPPVENC